MPLIHSIFKIEIFFLNGWKLHKGPCYNCTESDEGNDVTARRKIYIQQNRNPDAFGSWNFEPAGISNKDVNITDITTDVNNNISDVVLMVNSHEQWEMESSKITLDIDLSTSYNNEFDIFVLSRPDDAMTKIPFFTKAFLQVKVDANKRSDTGKPNNSPVVLVKPFYSLEHGKDYHLHIPVIDNDGDHIRCFLSSFVEGYGFSSLLKDLKMANLLSIDTNECILTVKVRSPTFQVDDTFGIPLTVKDYGKTDIDVGHSTHLAYVLPNSHVNILMFFKVTNITTPPKFVPPTPPNNQKFTIYVGGDFYVNVYAKPTQTNRHITKFNFMRRDGKPVNQTRHKATWDRKLIYISMSWSPDNEDLGHHIVCANAEDSAGVSTVELHCFRIEVKANILRPKPFIQGRPYYASFPETKDIVCPVFTYCGFPVYAATSNKGLIVNKIVQTKESQENVTIHYSHDVIYGNLSTTVAQVGFFADRVGLRQICLNASDTLAWTVQCLYLEVSKPDPCASMPCQHGGSCSPYEDNSGFQCYCRGMYGGQFCETRAGPCADGKNPCINSTCIEIFIPPYYTCYNCALGKTGLYCNADVDLCNPNNCNIDEVCHQIGSRFECLPGSFNSCSRGCTLNSSTVCVQNKCVCAMGMIHRGVCKAENNMLWNDLPHFVSPTPEIGSVITCDIDKDFCYFPIYISASSIPYVSSYDEPTISSHYLINFSTPIKDISTDIYLVIVSVRNQGFPFPKNNEFDICLSVAKVSSGNSISDKRCFEITEKAIPMTEYGKQVFERYPGCSFSRQTPPRESIIGCKIGKPCHFYMYAESNGTCPKLITHDIQTGIYTPVLISGLCRYEVVYINTSTSGRKTVCFMLCSKGESRCYQVYTNNITDYCSSNPCTNDAYCQTKATENVKCHCQKGYKGQFCEKGFCNRNNSCQNDAACLKNFNDTECVCRPGFIGAACSQTNFSNRTVQNALFTQASRVELLPCYINGLCSVPLSIFVENIKKLEVQVGYNDKTLEVRSLHLEASANTGRIKYGTLTFYCHELGVKMICVDSIDIWRSPQIEDEICFKINVTEGGYIVPPKSIPHFVPPTLPNSTVIQCVVKERCYLNLWAKNTLRINKCPLLQTDKSIEDGVLMFPLYNSTHQPCLYDVSIFRDNVTDLQLCFTLLSDASAQLSPNAIFKDKRCYFIKFVHELTGNGTCAGKYCKNGGFCDGSSSTYKCLCPLGFSGINCSKSHGNENNTALPSNEQILSGNLAFPKSVYCKYDTECMVLFSVSKTPGFHSGWNGTNIEVVNIRFEHIPSSNDVIGKVVLIHKSTGTDSFCIILSSTNGTSAYVQCCSIFMELVHQKAFPDYGQPRFIWPSPTNGTVFSCVFGQPCHVLITLSKEYNNVNCPVLKDRTSDGISTHIFVSNFTSKCHYDVWIGSPLSYNRKPTDYCFQSPTLGVLAEIRCFKVYFDQHAQKDATTTIIPSSLGSTASTSHLGLMCPKCDANLNCVWNGTCYPGQVCMIRSFHGSMVVHCSEKENCNFIKAAVPHVEILCCEDHQCITNIIR